MPPRKLRANSYPSKAPNQKKPKPRPVVKKNLQSAADGGTRDAQAEPMFVEGLQTTQAHTSQARELTEILEEVIKDITGETPFIVIAPERIWRHPQSTSQMRSPTAWSVQDLSPHAVRSLTTRRLWSFQSITFMAYPCEHSIPEFVITVQGFTQKNKLLITKSIMDTLCQEDTLLYTGSLAQDNPEFAGRNPYDAAHEILTQARVEVLVFQNRNIVANVYMRPPMASFKLWREWRDHLSTIEFSNPRNSTGRALPLPPCRGCHGEDHPTHMCPFPSITGWIGRSMEITAPQFGPPLTTDGGTNVRNDTQQYRGVRRRRDDEFEYGEDEQQYQNNRCGGPSRGGPGFGFGHGSGRGFAYITLRVGPPHVYEYDPVSHRRSDFDYVPIMYYRGDVVHTAQSSVGITAADIQDGHWRSGDAEEWRPLAAGQPFDEGGAGLGSSNYGWCNISGHDASGIAQSYGAQNVEETREWLGEKKKIHTKARMRLAMLNMKGFRAKNGADDVSDKWLFINQNLRLIGCCREKTHNFLWKAWEMRCGSMEKLDETERDGVNNIPTLYADFGSLVCILARETARVTTPKLDAKIRKLREELEAVLNGEARDEDEVRMRSAGIRDMIAKLEIKRFSSNRKAVAARDWLEGETISKYWTKVNAPPRRDEVIYELHKQGEGPAVYANKSKDMASVIEGNLGKKA
ncbi:hypothetical protein C8Q80DRAFT_1118390 [Daedaleopsis nitida]|nr:hypothetical protein C8Q80DRAFT_1118390 [Daedaleopsis nitida]